MYATPRNILNSGTAGGGCDEGEGGLTWPLPRLPSSPIATSTDPLGL